jgi:hypothetical protein
MIWFRSTAQNELTKQEFTSMLQYVSAFPGVSGIMVYSGGVAPSGYMWQSVVSDLITGVGDFI